MTFKTNLYDAHTLPEVIGQIQKLTGKRPKTATVDRGYKGKQQVPYDAQTTALLIKREKTKTHRRRAAIEPIIGHLKADHRVWLRTF